MKDTVNTKYKGIGLTVRAKSVEPNGFTPEVSIATVTTMLNGSERFRPLHIVEVTPDIYHDEEAAIEKGIEEGKKFIDMNPGVVQAVRAR